MQWLTRDYTYLPTIVSPQHAKYWSSWPVRIERGLFLRLSWLHRGVVKHQSDYKCYKLISAFDRFPKAT